MNEISALPWKDYVTISAAILGAVLGIMNMWQTISTRRVRLRVTPAHTLTGAGWGFSIDVVNQSNFALTIVEVGFTLNGRSINMGKRAAVTRPIIIDGKPWPRRLEARESVSLYFNTPDDAGLGKAYARTACGHVRYGDSPALKQIRQQANEA